MTKRRCILYVLLVFILLAVPFAGMLVTGASDSTEAEKRDLAPLPSVQTEDGSPNLSYAQDLGTYFEDHFAFRNALVSVNGRLKQLVAGTTPGDEIILGKDGWLFYSGTLDDYFRRDPMTPRELFIVAHNLRLMQDYCEQRGAKFVFVIAANKNSLYPQYMPGNYLEGTGQTNAMALIPYLDAAGVRYADMHAALAGSDEILYYRTDSHWTDMGAALGFEHIMQVLGLPTPNFSAAPFVLRTDQQGDLEEMLLPQGKHFETCPRIEYDWQNDAPLDEEGREAVLLSTHNPAASGSLVMYRDSFGTALVPFFAECFGQALFTRSFPYPLNDVNEQNATAVVVEKVERNLIDLAIRPAIMPPPLAEVTATERKETSAEIRLRQEGSLIRIQGSVPEELIREDTLMYMDIDGTVYETFLSTNEARGGNDFYLYIGKSQLEQKPGNLQLMISDQNGTCIVTSCKLTGGDLPVADAAGDTDVMGAGD